ncbi:PTS sugar transporter subunit IIB [Megalodesulfovibrio paquesii]
MFWVRVDNRLVHGQVIETWLPHTDCEVLVVCNDAVAGDVLQQEIMTLAIPHSIETLFVTVADLPAAMTRLARNYEMTNTLVLFNGCSDARTAMEHGFRCKVVNIGNLHYAPGKRQLLAHVAVSEDESHCLAWLEQHGVELDFRCLPTEPVTIKPIW